MPHRGLTAVLHSTARLALRPVLALVARSAVQKLAPLVAVPEEMPEERFAVRAQVLLVELTEVDRLVGCQDKERSQRTLDCIASACSYIWGIPQYHIHLEPSLQAR